MNTKLIWLRSLGLSVVALVVLSVPSFAARKDAPIPVQLAAAKSVYLINQSGDDSVLSTATDEFAKWGRFKFANVKDDADAVVIFTHKLGMDRWGNTSSIVMDVYIEGKLEPVVETKNAVKLITAPQHRTRACIADFKKRLERKA